MEFKKGELIFKAKDKNGEFKEYHLKPKKKKHRK